MVLPLVIVVEPAPFLATLSPPSLVATVKLRLETNLPFSTVIVLLSTFTSRFIVDVLPSDFGVIVTVPFSLAKFTVLPCVTASTALLFACKFQPAFNTSRTVAASFFFSSEIFNTLLSTTLFVGFSM